MVDGFDQDPIGGVSMAYTFAGAHAETHKHTNISTTTAAAVLSRRLVRLHIRAARPLGHRGLRGELTDWDSAKDVWELYALTKDFSQSENLAGKGEPRA